MDNDTGYECQVCGEIYGPYDYGWPPYCCDVGTEADARWSELVEALADARRADE
jgi:hypothetical protein